MPRIVDKPIDLPKSTSNSTPSKTGRLLMFQRVDVETGDVLATSSAFSDVFKPGASTKVDHYWIDK
jgi:hypothetical protein